MRKRIIRLLLMFCIIFVIAGCGKADVKTNTYKAVTSGSSNNISYFATPMINSLCKNKYGT